MIRHQGIDLKPGLIGPHHLLPMAQQSLEILGGGEVGLPVVAPGDHLDSPRGSGESSRTGHRHPPEGRRRPSTGGYGFVICLPRLSRAKNRTPGAGRSGTCGSKGVRFPFSTGLSESTEPVGRTPTMVGDRKNLNLTARLTVKNLEWKPPQGCATNTRFPLDRISPWRFANLRQSGFECGEIRGTESWSTGFVIR